MPTLTTKEAAARLGVHPSRVRVLINSGRLAATLQATPRGPVYCVSEESVKAFERLPQGWQKGRKRQ